MRLLEMSEPAVLEKLRHLPAEKRAEVVDFIDFLLVRSQDDGMRQAVAQLNSAAFAKVWDAAEDDVYDQL